MGATAAVLLSWAVALWLEGAAGLHTDAVVRAVVLTLTLARSPRTAGRRDRLLALALLPAAAAGCSPPTTGRAPPCSPRSSPSPSGSAGTAGRPPRRAP
ncbi:hypothetical protein [Streptomyces misionensis]|uniref:hypothetical protein n=1 Tax=Streptomyces misionensis TaxID=67331 RepID=UPI0036CC792F